MKTKEELRREGLEQRSQISRKEVKEKSRKIQKKVLEVIGEDDTVMSYVSYRNEVETYLLIEKLLHRKQVLAVPKVSGAEIKAYRIESMEELEENSRGIREPEKAEEISKTCIDTCIVPGVKFDIKGNRIGYGKGYYDRFLENFQGQKIGPTYQKLMEEKIPSDKWDIAMNKIVTEEKVIGAV